MSNSLLYSSNIKNNCKKADRKKKKWIYLPHNYSSYIKKFQIKKVKKETTPRKNVYRSKSLAYRKVILNARWIFLSLGRIHMLRHFLAANKRFLWRWQRRQRIIKIIVIIWRKFVTGIYKLQKHVCFKYAKRQV